MKFIVLTTLVFQIVLNVTDLLIVRTVKSLNNGDPWYFFIIWWCLLLFRGKSLQIYKDVHDWKKWVQLNRSCYSEMSITEFYCIIINTQFCFLIDTYLYFYSVFFIMACHLFLYLEITISFILQFIFSKNIFQFFSGRIFCRSHSESLLWTTFPMASQ